MSGGRVTSSSSASSSCSRSTLPSLTSLHLGSPPLPFSSLPSSSFDLLSTSHRRNNNKGRGGYWKNPVLYRTTLCDHWLAGRTCRYGTRCWYAHGSHELRYVPRLDQLPQNVRELLFVEPALASAFFGQCGSGRVPSPNESWPASSPRSSPSSQQPLSPLPPSSPDSDSSPNSDSSPRVCPIGHRQRAVGAPWPETKLESTPLDKPSQEDSLTEKTFHPFMDNYPLRFEL